MPLQQIRILQNGALDYPSGQPPNRSSSPVIPSPLRILLFRCYCLQTPQGIANALGYLQYHLYKLTERQNVSENNINTTLAALTTQLQQLTQLVANPPPPPIPNTPPPLVPSPLVSLPPTLMVRRMRLKLSCSLDFSGEYHNGYTFLNSCSLYICLAPEQFHNEKERILWALMFFKGSHAAKWSENVFRQEANTGIFPI